MDGNGAANLETLRATVADQPGLKFRHFPDATVAMFTGASRLRPFHIILPLR
jgi:hypothetical protein